MLGKIKNILMVTGAGVIFGIGVYFLYGAFDYDAIYKNANIWYKVSTDEMNPGEIVAIDMSNGYSKCDEHMIYIVANMLDLDEEVVVVFPNGGYWSTPGIDTVSVEIQKNFGTLEQDLRKR